MKSLLVVPLYIMLAFQLIHSQPPVPKPPAFDQEGMSKKGDFSSSIVGETGLEISTAQNLGCNINIQTHNDNSFKLDYRIWARAKSADQEKRFINLIEVKLHPYEHDHDNIHLQVLAPTRAPWEGTDYGVAVYLDILVPEYFYIDSRNSNSNLDFEGPFSGVEIDSEYGIIKLDNVKGESIIRASYSTVKLSQLEGSVSIEAIYSEIEADQITIIDGPGVFETSNGEINLENIEGSIEVMTEQEDIYVSNINAPRGSVVLRTNYGRIEADNVHSELICETNFGPIDLSNIVLSHGESKFETKHKPIDAEISQLGDSELIINNTYSSINLNVASDISARLVLAVDEGGKIHTRGLSIKPQVMERNHLEGLVGEGISRIEANVDGIGEINIQGQNASTRSGANSIGEENKTILSKTSGDSDSWWRHYDNFDVKFSEDQAGGKGVNIYTSSGEEIYFKIVDRDGIWESWIDNDGRNFKYDKKIKSQNWKYAKLWETIPKEVFKERDNFLD